MLCGEQACEHALQIGVELRVAEQLPFGHQHFFHLLGAIGNAFALRGLVERCGHARERGAEL